MELVRCAGVTKSFGVGDNVAEVLRGLDVRIEAGARVAVLGVSGSGKSTLLHILGGLERADSGEVVVCGSELGGLNEDALCRLRNRRIGFIYQAHHLLPELTALENVGLPLRIGGGSRAEAAARAGELLERAGLERRMEHKPHQLSGGERQRVAVCRALVTQPQLVLADEPTGSLDGETAARVAAMMLEMSETATLVAVTHDTALAARFDRACRLEGGRLRDATL